MNNSTINLKYFQYIGLCSLFVSIVKLDESDFTFKRNVFSLIFFIIGDVFYLTYRILKNKSKDV